MLDRDLAELYEVETKALNQAVKRNIGRFPHDFMFQLTKEEADHAMRYHFGTAYEEDKENSLKSQIVTSNEESPINKADSLRSQFVTLKQGQHLKYLPYAFTEQGVVITTAART